MTKLSAWFQHLYPKSQIDVFVTVLENDGSVLASAITCAGLAIINASIHVFDVIIGSSMVSLRVMLGRKDNKVFTDDVKTSNLLFKLTYN